MTKTITEGKGKDFTSSLIQSASYDEAAKILTITFKSGSAYDYYDVPKKIFEAFVEADSKGHFLNERILDVYNFGNAEVA